METAVSIDAFMQDVRMFFVLGDDEYDRVEAVWKNKDFSLIAFFEDMPQKYERWCDVQPTHYRWLIIQSLDELIEKYGEFPNYETPEYSRLRFFITAMCLKMNKLVGDNIDHLRVRHLAKNHVNFETLMDDTITITHGQAKPKLTVVVDNSKNKQ